MLPDIAPIRLIVAEDRVDNIGVAVQSGMQGEWLRARVRPGMRIAVGVGSRGIACIGEVVRAVISELLAMGAEPFLVPAMGSHGASTAAGQTEVLHGYGLSEATTGVPIESSMDVVQVGTTDTGMPVYFDANAAGADGIFVINRVKEHTSFKAQWESGLMKMLAVGLGKPLGASTIHNHDVASAMPAAAKVILANLPVLAGVGIVENGHHAAARIEVIPGEEIEAREPVLLNYARTLLPKIPVAFEPLHALVLQEIGKDISGTGMDLNVVGMWRRIGGAISPRIDCLAALDLTADSHGNAIGVGHADLISQRLRNKIDFAATHANCLTSHNYAGGKVPITLATDRAVIEAALAMVDRSQARLLIMKSTLEMTTMWVSRSLLPVVTPSGGGLQQLGDVREIGFDGEWVMDPCMSQSITNSVCGFTAPAAAAHSRPSCGDR